jgi:hypothetical protein
MMTSKELRLAEKRAAEQRQLITDLRNVAKDMERSERWINDLKAELQRVNAKHQGRRTTRDDVDYLTDLLACAKKKLAWEKSMASLQKRTPALLEKMTRLLNDPAAPPPVQIRAEILECLRQVHAAMERLQGAKVE